MLLRSGKSTSQIMDDDDYYTRGHAVKEFQHERSARNRRRSGPSPTHIYNEALPPDDTPVHRMSRPEMSPHDPNYIDELKSRAHEAGNDFQEHMKFQKGILQQKMSEVAVNRVIISLQILSFIHSTCFFAVNTMHVYLYKQIGIKRLPESHRYVQLLAALVHLISAPFFGRVGDLYGSKKVLLISCMYTACSYIAIGMARNLTMLYAAMFPAYLMHPVLAAQMIVVDLSDMKHADAFGKLAMAQGLGMMIGPLFARRVASIFSEGVVPVICSAATLAAMVIARLLIPSCVRKNPPLSNWSIIEIIKLVPSTISKIWLLIRTPGAMAILIVKTISMFPTGLWQSHIGAFIPKLSGKDQIASDYLIWYVALVALIMQEYGISFMRRCYSEKALLKLSSFVVCLMYLFLPSITSILEFCLMVIPLVFGFCTIVVLYPSALVRLVPEQHTGLMLGINTASNLFIKLIAHPVGDLLIYSSGRTYLYHFGAICNALAIPLISILFETNKTYEHDKLLF